MSLHCVSTLSINSKIFEASRLSSLELSCPKAPVSSMCFIQSSILSTIPSSCLGKSFSRLAISFYMSSSS